MRGGRVKTVKLEGYQVLLQCFLAGLPQQLFVLQNVKNGVSRFKFIPLVKLFEKCDVLWARRLNGDGDVTLTIYCQVY